jgi:hypothetical protein
VGEAKPRRATLVERRGRSVFARNLGWVVMRPRRRPHSYLNRNARVSSRRGRPAGAINAACCRPACLKLKIQKFQMLPHTKY